MPAPRRIPFASRQRARLAELIVASLRTGSEPLSVLDVGARADGLAASVRGDRFERWELPSDPGADCALPFEDGAFDLVLGIDVLERVPAERRDRLLEECVRVGGRFVAVAGAFNSPRISEALEELDAAGVEVAELAGVDLPSRKNTETLLRARGATVRAMPFGSLERWTAAARIASSLAGREELGALESELALKAAHDLRPCTRNELPFRHLLLAGVDGTTLPPSEAFHGAPEAPGPDPFDDPEATLAALALVGGLVANRQGEVAAMEAELELARAECAALGEELRRSRERVRAEEARRAGAESALETEREERAAILADNGTCHTTIESARARIAELERQVDVERRAHAARIAQLEEELGLTSARLDAGKRNPLEVTAFLRRVVDRIRLPGDREG